MDYNLHTHTKRCHHATGEPEDYVLAAIRDGMKLYGFSDHIPHQFPDGRESGYRVPMAEGVAYCEEIRALSEKYKEKIDIRVGFEAEYYPLYFEQMLKNAIDFGAEYLILGQHFIHNEHPNGRYVIRSDNEKDHLAAYSDMVIEAMRTGVFTYVAHPDVFQYDIHAPEYEEQMRRICIAARENNTPLEINFLGIREKRIYPNMVFWRIAGEEKAPVTYGLDAHRTEDACDRASLAVAQGMVEEYKLNYIGMPKMIDIRSK